MYSLLGLWIGQRQERNYGLLHVIVQISNVSKEPCHLVLVPSPLSIPGGVIGWQSYNDLPVVWLCNCVTVTAHDQTPAGSGDGDLRIL